ncbi:VOC family protein [uncultured Tateyamaria sp.]|nr:VOC family protein [uncultured Tateyamaria sp.]
MAPPFVWFDNMTPTRQDTTDFLQEMFGWQPQDIGPMTFLTAEGADTPFAATCDMLKDIDGWVPYIEVDDLSAALARARRNGASVIAEDVRGPAGDASFIRDPGGSAMALWKRADGV